ncbi:hypothetical protein VNO80_28142 [Phaseolus coccineus]|uniref:Uncharacterized protein n=1 Tax=Phaseolus coccineus TaxID=3886 RepID=A0AAN9QHV8_PHACN
MLFAYVINAWIEDALQTIIPLLVEYIVIASGYGYEVGAVQHAYSIFIYEPKLSNSRLKVVGPGGDPYGHGDHH